MLKAEPPWDPKPIPQTENGTGESQNGAFPGHADTFFRLYCLVKIVSDAVEEKEYGTGTGRGVSGGMEKLYHQLFSEFSPAEQEQLIQLLRKIYVALQ